jgi:hypothetical protein
MGIELPNPHLGDRVNHNMIQSGFEGGVDLFDLPINSQLEIRTRNRSYRLVNQSDGHALLSGHPEYGPTPTLVRVAGSNWGDSMLRAAFVGRGMHLEFQCRGHKGPIITSRIEEIREVG